MPVFNTAVILWSWGQPVSLHDRNWYHDYFFDPVHGQAAYWLKQSSNQLCITGQVFDWIFDTHPGRDFGDRTSTASMAIAHMQNALEVDFGPYDGVVVVLGIPKDKASDGGSSRGIKTDAGKVNAVVTRLRDSFDFVAHELGHAIGLDHSFTFDPNFQAIGDAAGGYGHPHCIMSQAVYGGMQAQARHDAPAPLGDHAEYRDIGPSLNGAAALARGWIDAHPVMLTPGFDGAFEIRARQWGGRDPAQPPQGIRLQTPDGATYVVDFYESRDWDQGLTGNRLIITQDHGGLGETHYPHSHVGTWLASLTLPASLTGPMAVVNVPGPIGLIPLFHDPVRHVLKVAVKHGAVSGGVIAMSHAVATVPTPGLTGSVVFNEGERFCVVGEWPWSETFNRQTVTLEATHARAHPGTVVDWTIDGVPCPQPSGTVPLTKTVLIADPKQLDLAGAQTVEVGYRIEPLPLGSRLILTNRPEDESYSVDAKATFSTSVATSARSETVDFAGHDYQFPPEFWERYGECLGAFLERKLKDSQTRIVIDRDGFKIPTPLEFEAVRWLDGLTYTVATGDRAGFELAAATLRNRLKRPTLKLLSFDMTDRLDMTMAEGPVAPAGRLRSGPDPQIPARLTRVSWPALIAAAALGALAALAATALF